jgi:hypothetical protein
MPDPGKGLSQYLNKFYGVSTLNDHNLEKFKKHAGAPDPNSLAWIQAQQVVPGHVQQLTGPPSGLIQGYGPVYGDVAGPHEITKPKSTLNEEILKTLQEEIQLQERELEVRAMRIAQLEGLLNEANQRMYDAVKLASDLMKSKLEPQSGVQPLPQTLDSV